MTSPSQFRLPPSGNQPHFMGSRDFADVEAVKLSDTPYFENINKMTEAQMRAIRDLPPAQQAAAMMSLNAQRNKGIADTSFKVGMQDVQSVAEADRANAATQRMQENANVADTLSYEQRTLKGLDNTQQSFQNYMEALDADRFNKMFNNSTKQAINSSVSDVAYVGNGQFEQTTDSSEIISRLRNLERLMDLDEEEKKKKTKVVKKGGRFTKYKK